MQMSSWLSDKLDNDKVSNAGIFKHTHMFQKSSSYAQLCSAYQIFRETRASKLILKACLAAKWTTTHSNESCLREESAMWRSSERLCGVAKMQLCSFKCIMALRGGWHLRDICCTAQLMIKPVHLPLKYLLVWPFWRHVSHPSWTTCWFWMTQDEGQTPFWDIEGQKWLGYKSRMRQQACNSGEGAGWRGSKSRLSPAESFM